MAPPMFVSFPHFVRGDHTRDDWNYCADSSRASGLLIKDQISCIYISQSSFVKVLK